MSRIINALGLVTIIVGSLEAGGAFDLMSPKVTAVVVIIGGIASSLNERLQGGLSNPEARAEAAKS